MSESKPQKRIEEFEKLAYGMFIHWGLYSLLGKGEWAQNNHKIPKTEYIKLKDKFTAEDFDAPAIAAIAKKAGMKYICLTTRHHEGFSLYDTKGLCDFDAPQSPAARDLVAEFVDACNNEGIVPFFYHTTLDWYQQSFEDDFNAYLDYLNKSVEILCTNYGKIGGLWFDGNWSKPDADWKEDQLYATIRKHQPDAMIINNTGLSAQGQTGHPEIDSVTFERGTPIKLKREDAPKYIAGEMCETLNKHWGIALNDFHYISPRDVIERLCACRKVGANCLLNVGPTAHGKIPAYETALLEKVGQWINICGDIFYYAKPSQITSSNDDFALEHENKTYIFMHDLCMEGDENVIFGGATEKPRAYGKLNKKITSVKWLDSGEKLEFCQDIKNGLCTIQPKMYPYGTDLVVRIAQIT